MSLSELIHPRIGRLSKSTPQYCAPARQRGSFCWASSSHASFRTTTPATTPAAVVRIMLPLVHMPCLMVTMECRTSAKRHPKFPLPLLPGLDEAVGMASEVCRMIKPCRLVDRASDVCKTGTSRCTLWNQPPVPLQSKTLWRPSRKSVVKRRRSHARFSKLIGTKP